MLSSMQVVQFPAVYLAAPSDLLPVDFVLSGSDSCMQNGIFDWLIIKQKSPMPWFSLHFIIRLLLESVLKWIYG